jgi:hypothetical protein
MPGAAESASFTAFAFGLHQPLSHGTGAGCTAVSHSCRPLKLGNNTGTSKSRNQPKQAHTSPIDGDQKSFAYMDLLSF